MARSFQIYFIELGPCCGVYYDASQRLPANVSCVLKVTRCVQATQLEMTTNAWDGLDFYDISLVVGVSCWPSFAAFSLLKCNSGGIDMTLSCY